MAGQIAGVNLMPRGAMGNRLGWIVGGVIALLLSLIVFELVSINRLTPPTSLLIDTAARQPLSLEVPAATIFRSDAAGNSAPLYRKAIDELRREPSRYAAAETADSPDDFEQSSAGTALLAAAPMAGDAGLPTDPAERAGYEPPTDDLDALIQAGRLLGHAGVLRLPTQPDQARQWFEAQFALGMKLFDGRFRAAEAAAGLAMARDAAVGLREVAEHAGDKRRAAVLATFDRAAFGLQQKRIGPVTQALGTVDGNQIAQHAGDVYTLCDPGTAEHMWRIEAILALGRHRFNIDRPADRLIVPRRLDELEKNERDPFVLAAIHAAKELTIEAYRTLQ